MANSDEKMTPSILEYYQGRGLNPVPIHIEDRASWQTHVLKRNNLYENHLKIPQAMFADHSVIEFGCNSGENALHLASLGAQLTLVEPNDQVLPRLKDLFEKMGYTKNIAELVNTDIAGFKPRQEYDIMLAEGFLTMIENRGDMFLKICSLIKPGGFGVISFDDRYGSLLEVVRQLILKRACQLKGINDFQTRDSLEVAQALYLEDFQNINASRPFEAWWEDALLNPYVAWEHLGTYDEFISLIEQGGCEFFSSSPRWSLTDHYSWYKNVPTKEERHQKFLDDWHRAFAFFFTGVPIWGGEIPPADKNVVDSLSLFINQISNYVFSDGSIEAVCYPQPFDNYLNQAQTERLKAFNIEMKEIFERMKICSFDDLVSQYKKSPTIRSTWGMSSPYISFKKLC